MKILRWLFFPISLLYAGIMMCRNWAFDNNWFAIYRSSIPTISIGNLNTGGTGKTPFVEYLIRLFKENKRIATLSRGYGRKSTGFLLASSETTAHQIGDEPCQIKLKYGDDVVVAVDEKRANGLKQLELLDEVPELVIMDDAFQHRYAARDINILLTSFEDLFINDFVLPTGNLREVRSGAKRADLILVTKCPMNLSATEKGDTIKRLTKYCDSEHIYFSNISYGQFKNLKHESVDLKTESIAVLTGIANPTTLLEHLREFDIVEHFKFNDHHAFSRVDLDAISVKLSQKYVPIVTTEKDMVRLLSLQNHSLFSERDIYYLPIAFELDREEDFFNELMSALNRVKS